jgi:predicted methyltransferase
VKITQDRFNNKDKIECIKRFAISGRWCTVVDDANGKIYKLMKTGSKLMTISIQSLNAHHSKSYDFPIDETVFKYNMRN